MRSRSCDGTRALGAVATALTLARLAATAPFVWLLARVASSHTPGAAAALAGAYLAIALSDFVDGPVARRAGSVSARGARLDAAADVCFNFASLAAGAVLGLVSPWTPAALALLAARFAWRNRRCSSGGRLREDRGGKLAGALFYVLVGFVVLAAAAPATRMLATIADRVVVAYVVAVLVVGGARRWRERRPSSGLPRIGAPRRPDASRVLSDMRLESEATLAISGGAK